MKKGIIVVLILALLLCTLTAAGGGILWYFVLRQTPEKAFAAAVTNVSEAEYYKFRQTGNIESEIKVPDYPEANITMLMNLIGEGKVDIQNNKLYTKTEIEIADTTEITEMYSIGDDVYTKDASGNFEKTLQEEQNESMTTGSLGIITGLSEDAEYIVLDEETYEGTDCYHYNLPLNKTLLTGFLEGFTKGFAESGMDISPDNLDVQNANMEIWISKKDSTFMKTLMNIEKISFATVEQETSIEVNMNDISISTTLFDWDEKVSIEVPI